MSFLTTDDIDQGFHEAIERLADHATDMLPGGAEQPYGTWRTVTTERFSEAIEEALLSVEAQDPAELASDERLNSLDRVA